MAKKATAKKSSAKRLIKPAKKTTTKSKPVKSKAVRSSKPPGKPSASKKPEPEVSLGRPLVTQEEKLYLLFKDDYHARQIFEFLRVETVKELEQFSPSQIVRILSKPISTTVERIRQRLAEMKRSLRDDADFAAEFREQHPMK